MNKKLFLTILVALLFADAGLSREKTRILEGYDPRIPMQIMVMPATLARNIKRTDPKVVSGILETEMLRLYEVESLRQVEQYLENSKQTLETAFTMKALPVLKDSARIDAMVHLDIYRWEPGSPGMLFLGSKGIISMKIMLSDPYDGKIYWSLNRTESVKENDSFFECITSKFKTLIDDIETDLKKEADRLTKQEKSAREKAEKLQKKLEKKKKE